MQRTRGGSTIRLDISKELCVNDATSFLYFLISYSLERCLPCLYDFDGKKKFDGGKGAELKGKEIEGGGGNRKFRGESGKILFM